ncbi:HNH endonuclease [Nocardia bhagyanarayanae]|uniref:Restriction endonuclease n=1 Tax=Nocardia bhagyanarayanae TaxID=1215925 RepID=A0A543EW03_9NOCA|nr:hypothetical protein [Nocardia bhagyanarayanae]TQM25741.1 hypothetical protein FB390_5902 [Nocardia bhagyanarayanae]
MRTALLEGAAWKSKEGDLSTTPNPRLIQFIREMEHRRVEAGNPSYARIVKVADRHGFRIGQGTISNMLSGRAEPRLDTVRAFIRAVLLYENPERNVVELDADVRRWQARWAQAIQPLPAEAVGPALDSAIAQTPQASNADTTANTPASVQAETRATIRGATAPTTRDDQPNGDLTAAPGSLQAIGAEAALRQRIFESLSELVSQTGSVTRQQLSNFMLDGRQIRLIDHNRGIYNPRDMQATLSILSAGGKGFADEEVGDSLFSYAYRDGATSGDNRKLRNALDLKLPIILLRRIDIGVYVPIFPVYVVADDKVNRRFLLLLENGLPDPLNMQPFERDFAQRIQQQRLHQPAFRGAILRAYEVRCAVCDLGHGQLLDAAHISAAASLAQLGATSLISDGICLCKLHRAAFDANILGIAPDYRIWISEALMAEDGNAMMLHSLQEMHGRSLRVPARSTDRPSIEQLRARFEDFKKAVGNSSLGQPHGLI